jgi:hypothetical protein
MRALRISRTWPFPKGFELQLGGMVSYPKNGNILGFGPLLRWNFLENGRCRLFADAGADILQTGDEAYIIPLGGTGYNFLLRAGRRRQLHSMERLGGLVGPAAHVSLICHRQNEAIGIESRPYDGGDPQDP